MEMSCEDKNFKRFVSDDLFIGKGAFGDVYGPCDLKGKKFAIKKRWITNDMKDTEKQLSALCKMMSLRHKHLITVYDVSLEPPAVYILIEYASGGSLKEVLSARESDLPLEIQKDWGTQIAEGMAYLHENDIVHRDLKSPNIVIMEADASSNPYNKTLKITDFDQIREHAGTQSMSNAGTCPWAAPEVLTTGMFSKASDVWSYGVVQWEILTRNIPYKDIPDHTIITDAIKGKLKLEIPDSCPDIIKYILKHCLSYDKCKRLSFCEILLELQRLLSAAGEDLKANGFKKMDKDQSKSLGHRIKKLFAHPKTTSLFQEKKFTSSRAVRTIKDQVRQHRDLLEERMDPDFGLLDIIRANGTIGWREIEDITSKSSSCKRNSQLLDYMLAKGQCDSLITALRDADQMHIVNYLTTNGEYCDEFGEDWPLTAKDILKLDTNHRSLVDLLELTDLLGLLYSSKVINRRQMDLISSKPTSHERNNALLEILRRRSLRDYRQTITCLRESKQNDIAEVLERGGVVVRVHANLDGENLTETENEIATKIANLLINSSIDQPSRVLEVVQHKVIAAKTGRSIVLYIYCKTIKELQQLHESLISGRLKDSVEVCFNGLLKRSQKIAVAAITVSSEDFQKMRKHFKDMSSDDQAEGTTMKEAMTSQATLEAEGIHLWPVEHLGTEEEISRRGLKRKHSSDTELTEQLQTEQRMESTTETDHQPSTTTLNELPLELLDVVLEKSFLHWTLNPSFHQRDEDVVRAMAAIDFCWFQRLTRPRFKKRIWRRFKDFYEKTRKSSAIVRNNRNYLLDNIQSNYKLISSLLSLNCITEKQRHFIQRQRSNCNDNKKKEQSHFIQLQRSKQDKNSEMLHQMRSFDETKFSNFAKCLRQTNQKTVARIMENGGGVMKVEVQYRSAKCTTSREAQLHFHKNIEDLRNRIKPRSCQTDKLISQLREEGIEILNSQLDRQTVVVWIWCYSQEALQHIQRVYESNQLREVLFGVANIPDIDQSKVINIDSNQYKKAVVVCSISINFTQRIDVGKDESVRGVTKLRSEIYVLCQPSSSAPNAIRVFEDRNPFNLQKIITIKEIKDPFDIGSSEKENCLYVSDVEEKCVWKIKRETDDQNKIIKLLTTDYPPYNLSVSSKGQLLLVNDSSSSLMIYGSDAELVRSIQLPGYIWYLYHAVETSNGNFIISYEEKLEEDDEEEDEKDKEEEEEQEEGEEVEKEEQKKEEENEGEDDEKREEEKKGDSWSRGRNSIKVEKEEEEDATEREEEEGEEEDMEEKREVKDDKELGEEIEGESGSNGRNSIKVEKEEDEEEECREEEGGKRDPLEEKERKSRSSEKTENSAISEFSRDGQVVRRFVPSNETQQLKDPWHLSLDSDDQVFVADFENDRVILLDSDLKWNRILCPTKVETEETKIQTPDSLFYDEVKKQLIVGGYGVNVYTLSRK